MSRLDEELRQALRRAEPPAGFEGRLMRRVQGERAGRPAGIAGNWRRAIATSLWWLTPQRALAIAFCVLFLLVAGFETLRYRRVEQERREAEQAQQQLKLALAITARRLNQIEKMLQQNADGHLTIQPAPRKMQSKPESL